MSDRRLRLWLMAVAALSIALFWLTPVPLGVPGEWTWLRIPVGRDDVGDAVLGWLGATIAAAVYFAVAWFGSGRVETASKRGLAAWLGGLWLAGFFWTGSVQDAAVYPYRTEKYPLVLYYPGTEGYFWTARYEMTDVRTFLASYEERMAEGDVLHVGTHPPGLFLLHRGLIRLCEWSPGLARGLRLIEPPPVAEGFAQIEQNERGRPNALDPPGRAAIWLAALLTQLAGVGTVVPLYWLLRLDWPRKTSWKAAALWPLVPALAVFLPKSDALYPALGVLLVAAWLTGWRRGSIVWCALAGMVLWLGLFFSLAMLPVALLCGVLTLYEGWIARPNGAGRGGSQSNGPAVRRLAVAVTAGSVGFLVPVGLMWLLLDLNLVSVWAWNYRNHAAFYDQFDRTYRAWLLVNPLELALGVGLPVMVLAAAAYRRLLALGAAAIPPVSPDGTAVEPSPTWRSRAAGPLWCCAAVWVVLWLSGKNMGEAARLWLILMPWPVWMTAAALGGTTSEGHAIARPLADRTWLFALALQSLVALATVTRVFGFDYGLR